MQKLNSASTMHAIDHRIDHAIFWLTITALIAMPLMFNFFDIVAIFNELKIVSLHFLAGLILILWSWQIAIRIILNKTESHNLTNWDLFNWADKNPARWAILATAIWFFSITASTFLSPFPVLSFYGVDEGRNGYNLYDYLSLMTILASVIFRFRTTRSLELLTYTLVITGTITATYGIAQHYGWDPIGGNAGRTRVIASFGNTLNFGGYMVMSIPATLALTYKRLNKTSTFRALITVALSLQLIGLWFTAGLGPFISTSASIASFFVIAAALGSLREILRGIFLFASAAIIALIIIAMPSPQDDVGLHRVSKISNQFSSETQSTNIQGGLTGRLNIWGSMLNQATNWEVPIEEPMANRVLRPIFGVGPDMLIYVYPLIGAPQSRLALVDHTHNYPLQVLMEHGFMGFIVFLAMAMLIGITIILLIRNMRNKDKVIDKEILIILALVPAIIGKSFELQTGVGRISDMTMNFALLGGVIAIYEIVNYRINTKPESKHRSKIARKTQRTNGAPNKSLILPLIVVASLITISVITNFVSWDLRRLSASRSLAIQWDHPEQLVRSAAWEDAQKRSPERKSFTFTLFETYHHVSKEQYALGNVEEALRLIHKGRDLLIEYEKYNPLELDVQIGLSKSAATLMEWGYFDYADELAGRSIELAEANPAYPTILGSAATALTSVNQHELAIKYADEAIETESMTQPWSKAWYAKGRALYELGKEQQAIDALITATKKQPGAEGALLSHQVLAQIYGFRGDTKLSKYHQTEGSKEITVLE